MQKQNHSSTECSNIGFVAEILDKTESNINIVLKHPFIYELSTGVLNAERIRTAFFCDNRLKLSFSMILLDITNKSSVGNSGDQKLFLRLAKNLATMDSNIKRIFREDINFKEYDIFNEFGRTNFYPRGICNEYNNYLLNVCKSKSIAVSLATIVSFYHLHHKIALVIKNSLSNLTLYPEIFRELLEYWASHVINIRDMNILYHVCDEFAFVASSEEKEEMYQTFRKNILYHWLVFNDIYHKPQLL
jgi:thiaminase